VSESYRYRIGQYFSAWNLIVSAARCIVRSLIHIEYENTFIFFSTIETDLAVQLLLEIIWCDVSVNLRCVSAADLGICTWKFSLMLTVLGRIFLVRSFIVV